MRPTPLTFAAPDAPRVTFAVVHVDRPGEPVTLPTPAGPRPCLGRARQPLVARTQALARFLNATGYGQRTAVARGFRTVLLDA